MIGGDAIRGYIDLMVLSILREHASYPYELVKTITEISGGAYAIKQTTLYSAVKRLEATGLVASFPDVSESGKPRTYYRMTDEGRASLRSKIAEWKATRAVVDRFVKGSH
ncbi:transcriptional regulator [Peptidiphaga gingivicola]|uniref:Transcriptional regulator n=1 Tax=Peptidiphaga gingivicola TaxID=2741497 RepID=A0A179B2S8_9ACTO|nr:PadR family transcriptional regulator [Peptidiphaga gingivicola]OAP85780.1 transcriptional regulator [Peptidiphaga gingivicola]